MFSFKGHSEWPILYFVSYYDTREIWNISDGETDMKLHVIRNIIKDGRYGFQSTQTKLGTRFRDCVISLIYQEYNGSVYFGNVATSLPNNTASQLKSPSILKPGSTLPKFPSSEVGHLITCCSSLCTTEVPRLLLGQGTGNTDWLFQDIRQCLQGLGRKLSVCIGARRVGTSVEWRIALHRTLLKCQRHCSRKKTWDVEVHLLAFVFPELLVVSVTPRPIHPQEMGGKKR